ncbi:MAG: carboxypeptidase-like regulatory domain-containing protein [Flammeovirgaceae bacterium]|nr:carboxypeptidase-like regulatory domain-containing protein [Flammeovirgaceae bacterium]
MKKLSILILVLSTSILSFSQVKSVTLSGVLKDKTSKSNLSYVNVLLKLERDSSFVSGTVTDDEGRYTMSNVKPDNYILEKSFVGYRTHKTSVVVGRLSEFLDLGVMELEEDVTSLNEVIVTGTQDAAYFHLAV